MAKKPMQRHRRRKPAPPAPLMGSGGTRQDYVDAVNLAEGDLADAAAARFVTLASLQTAYEAMQANPTAGTVASYVSANVADRVAAQSYLGYHIAAVNARVALAGFDAGAFSSRPNEPE